MDIEPARRVDQLANRVRWLDSYRRAIAVGLAAVFFVAMSRELCGLFGNAWPSLIPCMVSLMFSVALWWFIEVAFAWLTAFWETEYVQLVRDKGLPRAELIQRRR